LARFCENTERHPKETSIHRIYFCAPTVVPGPFIVDELLPVRVEQRQIEIVAYEETALQDLPAAVVAAQSSDLFRALQHGCGSWRFHWLTCWPPGHEPSTR
jgi:hypothetical protein